MYIALYLMVLFLIVICFKCYKQAYERPENFPPGPPRLPVYGAYWIVLANSFNNLSEAFIKLGKQYKTKIVGTYFAGLPSIIINDPVLLKEMLNREEFDGRNDIFLARLRSYWKRFGIFFTDSYFWHVQRRFSLRIMRDYGFGKRDENLEYVISAEMREIFDIRINGAQNEDEEKIVRGDLINMPYFFSVPFINGLIHVFSQMVIPRKGYGTLLELSEKGFLFQRSSDDLGRALTFTPWIRHVIPNWSGYNGLRSGNQMFLDFFKVPGHLTAKVYIFLDFFGVELINEVKSTQKDDYDRHFLDVYIKRMNAERKTGKKSTFSEDQLALICTDYCFPTATCVETTLAMLVETMLLHPEVQEKIHEEIDRVVGRDRVPTLNDRFKMPYTEACIREMMRLETPVPLGIPHRAMKDTTIGGYNVPEDTLVAGNFTVLHMSEEIWGDPEVFRPERYIKNGRLNVAMDKSLPFGAGRRLCAGETYARQSMFQVFATFMQAFQISTADNKPLKPLKRIPGIITTLPEFWVRATPR